ncbi:MAG: hypothetical protein NTU78_05780 [Alphaproteobacteria bacterium]|nr:hypothetical protein [Alphaproteobacteria bacterium]
MKYSLTTSLLLHASILIAALVTLPEANPYKIKPQEAVMVDISKISDTTKQMAMTKAEEPKPVEAPAPKKAEVVKKPEDTQAKIAEETKKAAKEAKAAEPPPPEPDALKELIKETVAEEPAPKKEKPKKEEVKKAEVKPKEKPKPEKKKPELDVAKLEEILNDDAFLNKENEEKTTDASIAATDGNPAASEANLQGTDNVLSATAIDALRSRIQECWSVPPGAREANITIRVRFQLNTDGTVIGEPQVMNGSAEPLFGTTARSTVAAILGCQSYDFLPQEQYDLWKDLILNFNPNMMS